MEGSLGEGGATEVKRKPFPEARAERVQTQLTDIYQFKSVARSYFCNTFVSLHKLLNLIPTVKSEQFNRLFWIYSRILDLLRGEFYSLLRGFLQSPWCLLVCVSVFYSIVLTSAHKVWCVSVS